MAIWSALFRNRAAEFYDAFEMRESTSAGMKAGILDWQKLYYGGNGSRLACTIVSKLCRTVFAEYSANISESGAKAEGLRQALARLDTKKEEAMQQAMIGGECLIKPVLGRDGFDFVIVPRASYCVLGRGVGGEASAYGTAETCSEGRQGYTLLECRNLEADGRARVRYRLYRAEAPGLPGRRVPLGTLARYAHLVEDAMLPIRMGADGEHRCLTGFVPLKMPLANCVDGSSEGVSVYAAAAGIIRSVDTLEAQLEREFENAASRVIASADLLARGVDGKERLDTDLFLALDDEPSNVGITVYAPPIRDESFLRRKNDALRSIESIIGFRRGVLSDVEATERTATEITSSAGEYNLAICDLQKVWAEAVAMAMTVCDTMGQMYLGWSDAACPAPVLDFGDGVLFDRGRVWGEYLEMVKSGMLKPEVALGWYFERECGEAEDQRVIGEMYLPR